MHLVLPRHHVAQQQRRHPAWWACLCLLAAWLALAGSSHGQQAETPPHSTRWGQWFDTAFQHYNDQHGLPNSGTTGLIQDGDGFLWIGTQDGLVRWDGYRFRIFRPDPGDAHSLPNNYIQALHLDHAGRLWIGTQGGGLARYEREQERFTRWQPKAGRADSLAHVSVTAISDDGAGGLWVGTHGGLDHLSVDGTLRHVWPQHAITSLQAGPDGTLWIASDKQLFRRSLRPGNAGNVSAAAGKSGSSAVANATQRPLAASTQDSADVLLQAEFASPIYCLFKSSDQRIWIGTRRDGAWRLDPSSASPQPVRDGVAAALAGEWISSFAEPAPGEIWIGSAGQGVVVYGGNNARHIRRNPLLASSLADDTIEAMLVDASGLVWLGTQQGISVHYPQTGVRTLFGAEQRQQGLIGKDVRSVLAAQDGRIWLGFAFQGVQILDPASRASTVLHPEPGQPLRSLPASQIMVSQQAANGDVYLGSGRGVYRVQHASSDADMRIARLELAPRDNVERTTSMLIANDTLWVGSNRDSLWQAALPRNPNKSGPAPLEAPMQRPALLDKLQDQRLTLLQDAGDGAIWVGTQNGLHWLHPQQNRLLLMPTHPDNGAQAGSGNIDTVLLDRHKRLWLGSSGTGIDIISGFDTVADAMAGAGPTTANRPLTVFSSPKLRIQHIGVKQGLPNGVINKLLEDQHGDIWASTDNGLAFINGRDFSVRALSRADGVAINTYWSNAGALTRHGELLFGGIGGLTVVQPALLRLWSYQPPLVISEIRVKGKPVAASPYFAHPGQPAQTLELAAHENQIAVEFAALDFSAPELNRYSWRLARENGNWLDPDWSETDATRRLATFANLPPGQYQLHMRGSNRMGAWNPRDLILNFRVLPAWYQSWWWFLCLLAAAAIMVAAVVQLRTRNLREQRQQLERKVDHRTRQLHEKQSQLEQTNQTLQQVNRELEHSANTLRQTQVQLVQQEKMAALGALVTGVAHELNTPLGVSLSALDGARGIWQQLCSALLQGSAARSTLETISAEGLEYLDLALRNNRRAADLVTHFKSITVNPDSMQQENLHLASFLHDFAQMVEPEFRQHGHQLQLAIAADLPDLKLVPEALCEALECIFRNIRDHAFDAGVHGVIRLCADCSADGGVSITISDNGHGIAQELLGKVFDPFFSTKTGSGKHVGLGLHIAWNQVTHRLHGQLGIRSELGQGTTVTIGLPNGG
jgi:ligand-binding sensor domain-containing protein/signal transduction histidine kinase